MKEATLDTVLEELRALLENDQLDKALRIIEALRPADQADLVEELDADDQVSLLTGLSPSDSADVLEEMDNEEAASVASLISPVQLADILDEMEVDEAADVLGDLPDPMMQDVLQEMEDPEEILPLLRYPDDTAGGLMISAVISLHPDWTMARALVELRTLGAETDSSYYLFVTDENQILLGVLGLRDLVTAPPEARVGERMKTDIISVLVTTG